MNTNRSNSKRQINEAASAQVRRNVFVFFYVLGFLAVMLATNVQKMSAEETQTDQVVFFSIPVNIDVAQVLASPSVDSYQTGTILKDRYVEVYFQNSQGFCAIRPPQGSFSWINAKFVEVDGKFGRVVSSTGKAIPSRVGGDSPTTSSVVQVGLQHGQKIKILGKVTLSNGSTWYKIAPPPGEFRWIAANALLQDEATASLPHKLTFQSEYLSSLNAQKTDDSDLILPLSEAESEGAPATNASQVDLTSTQRTELASVTAYKMETSKLNADIFQALQNKPVSLESLKILELRAEALFDAAPNDNERFAVQSLYNLLKKAETESAQVTQTSPSQYSINQLQIGGVQPNVNEAISSLSHKQANAAAQPIRSFPQAPTNGVAAVQWVEALDSNGQKQMFPIDQNGNVLSMDQAFSQGSQAGKARNIAQSLGELPHNYSSADKQRKSNVSSKMSFAFSSANSPFSSKQRETKVISEVSPQNNANPSISKLPSLFPTVQTIVPPQDYNIGVSANSNRQNSKLVAQARRKENDRLQQNLPNLELTTSNETVVATNPTTPEKKPQGVLVFQEPKIAQSNTRDQNSQSAEPTASANNNVRQASVGKSVSTNKIKQTSAFTPITIRTRNGYDAVGTLIAVASTGDGAPKYALLDSNSGNLSITAYIASSQGVVLEKFIGKKVGVKGKVGTVRIDEKSHKLVVVTSIFPE